MFWFLPRTKKRTLVSKLEFYVHYLKVKFISLNIFKWKNDSKDFQPSHERLRGF